MTKRMSLLAAVFVLVAGLLVVPRIAARATRWTRPAGSPPCNPAKVREPRTLRAGSCGSGGRPVPSPPCAAAGRRAVVALGPLRAGRHAVCGSGGRASRGAVEDQRQDAGGHHRFAGGPPRPAGASGTVAPAAGAGPGGGLRGGSGLGEDRRSGGRRCAAIGRIEPSRGARCAAVLCRACALAAGDVQAARSIYEELSTSHTPPHIRTAACRGRILSAGRDAATIVQRALTGSDQAARAAVLQVIPQMPDDAVVQAVADCLPALHPQIQVSAIEALRRGSAAAVTALVEAVRVNSVAEVRVAALRALGTLGGPSTVGRLSEAAAGAKGAEQSGARGHRPASRARRA